jgi:hypothetical protein
LCGGEVLEMEINEFSAPLSLFYTYPPKSDESLIEIVLDKELQSRLAEFSRSGVHIVKTGRDGDGNIVLTVCGDDVEQARATFEEFGPIDARFAA